MAAMTSDAVFPVAVTSFDAPASQLDHPGPGVLDMAGVDAAFRAFRSRPPTTHNLALTLDLSNVLYHDQGVFVYIGALLSFRAKHGWPTVLRLPHEDGTVQWMRTFMFPEFIETVIGGDFVEILDSESRSRWSRIVDTGEPPQNYQLFGSEYQSGASRSIPPDRIIYLTPIQTVDLLPIGAVTSVRATLARQVAALTSSELKLRGVYSLLDTFIPLSDRGTEQGGRYARQIVEEFVTNSVLHSNPSLGYIYGRFDYGMPQQRAANKGFFGLSVWDNGTSASKVLTDSMGMPLNPLNVMNSAAEYANETFRVKYREPGVEDPVLENINIQGSSDVVDLLSRKQAYRALGMFLPGVTSEPGRESVRNPEDTPKIPNGRVPDTMSGLSGTGLDRVVQIAIDTLGGRIDYAGGQIRLRIAQSFDPGGFPRSNTYDVELTYGRDSVWPIEGNLLTFRLPGMWPS